MFLFIRRHDAEPLVQYPTVLPEQDQRTGDAQGSHHQTQIQVPSQPAAAPGTRDELFAAATSDQVRCIAKPANTAANEPKNTPKFRVSVHLLREHKVKYDA